MSQSGGKWAAVGVASLLLVLLGAHLAWEGHRYRLRTPEGTVRIGMTRTEVEAVFGPPVPTHIKHVPPAGPDHCFYSDICVFFAGGRVESATLYKDDLPSTRIPRPSLFEAARSWLTGKKG